MAGVSVTSLFVTEYVAPEAEPEVPVEMTEEEAAAAAAAAEAAQAQADAAFQEQLLTGYVGRRSINNEFLSWYSVLAAMPTITSVQDGAQDHFVFIDNQTTHTPELLQMPDYVPSLYIDNTQYLDTSVFTIDGRTINMNNDFHYRHYMSNMAAILRLGEWFDYLREQGCWDNTRVIIVSDHGHTLGQFPWMRVDDSFNVESVNPIFMVKDFGQSGEIKTDNTFMTNADTPFLAFSGLVSNPTNPFLDKPLSDEHKNDTYQHIMETNWRTDENDDTTFMDPEYLSFTGKDLFDLSNWSVGFLE
jgi:membrane-anchored protein YejM (alkaline phosphatase superfamily)